MIGEVRSSPPVHSPLVKGKEALRGVNDVADKAAQTVEIGDTAFPRMAIVSGVKDFFAKYPVVAKIFFLSHLFSIWQIGASSAAISKQARKFVAKKGMGRFDAAMKILENLGKITGYIATLAIGLEALEVGKKLGEMGLKAVQITYTAIGSWLDTIVLVGTILSAAKVALEGRRCWKAHKLIKTFTSEQWYRSDGAYGEKEYTLFKNHLLKMPLKETKQLEKALGVHGTAFQKNILKEMASDVPTQEELLKMRSRIEQMAGRLKVGRTEHLVTGLTAAVSLVGTGCLLFPPLHAVAVVLLIAAAVSTLAVTIFRQVKQYQFEDKLGLIKRPAQTPTKMNLFQRAFDFTKWQVGWYSDKSLVKKLFKAGSTVWENGISLGTFLGSILKVADVARAVIIP